MYEYEMVDHLEEGKEYKQGVILDFIKKHNYKLYSETLGVLFWDCEQTKCVVNRVVDKKFQVFTQEEYKTDIESVDGMIFAERIVNVGF